MNLARGLRGPPGEAPVRATGRPAGAIGELRAKAYKAGRQIRDGLLNIPDRLAYELASEARVDCVQEILARELEAALGPLAGAVR